MSAMDFVECEPPPLLIAQGAKRCRMFRRGLLSVIVAVEEGRWHISVAHPSRYPTWDEIKEVRYRFVPDDVTMAMLLPPRSQYVNKHPNCFHLHETRDMHEESL